jgi:toxin HigB-1
LLLRRILPRLAHRHGLGARDINDRIDAGRAYRARGFCLTYYALRNTVLGMIQSLRCKATAKLFAGHCPSRFRAFRSVVERKLAQLDAAATLAFLRSPPGNRLEALSGDRAGQHSIRINDQWRVCCVWRDGNVYDVELVDDH